MSKLKTLNKETVSFVLLNDFDFSTQLVNEIVETIWRSDERLEEIQRANTGLHSDGSIRCPNCGYSAFYPICTKCGQAIYRTAAKA